VALSISAVGELNPGRLIDRVQDEVGAVEADGVGAVEAAADIRAEGAA